MADSEADVAVAEEKAEPVVAEPARESADGGEGPAKELGAPSEDSQKEPDTEDTEAPEAPSRATRASKSKDGADEKPKARRLSKEKDGGANREIRASREAPSKAKASPERERARRASKERAAEPAVEVVDLPPVAAVQVANDGQMSKHMVQLMKDLDKKQSWVLRATALRKLQGLLLGGAIGKFPAFLKAMKSSEFAAATKDLFAELRSQLVKEMGDTVLGLVKGVLDADAIKDYDNYFTDIVLVEAFRTVCKANVAIAASAETCLKGLVKDFQSMRLLRGVVEPMSDAKASSRLRLQCAQLLTISLESWPSDKLSKGVMEIESKKVNALDCIENGILKCLSDTKSETRVAAKICHDKYSELFPQRAPRVLERMNRQQLRVVREPEQPEQGGSAEGEDKDKKNDAPKRKQRIISVSPERKAAPPPAPPAQQQASEEEYEKKKRKRDRELAERARARGAARGDGKEVDPAEALVLCQGKLAEAKDRVEELEKHLAEEKRKCKNLQKLKDEAVKVAEQEKHALEKVLEVQKAGEGKAAEADGGESEGGKEGQRPEQEDRLKDVQQRLKKEQARARKITEERDELQRKCKAAENALEAAKLAAKDKDDKKDKRRGGGREEENAEGEQRGARQEERAGRGEKKEKAPEKKSIREEKEEASAAERAKQLEHKNKKLAEKMNKAQEDFGLLEEEKKILEEKLAEYGAMQERVRVEMEVKGGELRQVKERWQVREKEWFQARMALEREVEMLKTELQRHDNQAKRWTEEREQLLKRVGDLRVRLGEDEESEGEEEAKEEDPYSAANLEKRKAARERGQRERDEDDGEEGGGGGGGGDSAMRQLKMELEEVKQQLMRQEALAAEARATASMAQQELHYWRQRVTELEPERTRATHMADKLRAELEWRGRVQGQEERRLRSHAQHAEEGRRRVEAQLACVAMEVERGQIDIAEGRLTAETIVKKIEVLVNEEAMRVKMHRNADVYLSSDMCVEHPMFAHHAVAPPLFAPPAPPQHGWLGGGAGGGAYGPGGGGGEGRGMQKALPWVAFDVELGNRDGARLPVIVAAGGGGGKNGGGPDGQSPLKKRQVKQSKAGSAAT